MWTYVTFDQKLGYPVGADMFYECQDCGKKVASSPPDSIGCSCGNIFIDVDAGRISVKLDSRVRLMRRAK